MYRFGTGVLTGVTTCSSCCSGSLCSLCHSIFLRAITAVIHTALLLCLLYLIRLGHMNLSTEQDR